MICLLLLFFVVLCMILWLFLSFFDVIHNVFQDKLIEECDYIFYQVLNLTWWGRHAWVHSFVIFVSLYGLGLMVAYSWCPWIFKRKHKNTRQDHFSITPMAWCWRDIGTCWKRFCASIQIFNTNSDWVCRCRHWILNRVPFVQYTPPQPFGVKCQS